MLLPNLILSNLKTTKQMSIKSDYLWEKKYHKESSLPSKSHQRVLFIGRWQPLHIGHINLFQQALFEDKKLLIAIRDGEVDDKNPFTAEEVKEKFKRCFSNEILHGTIEIIIIPDICEVAFGRGVGYDVVEYIPPTEIADISATKIREKMKADGKL
jgi:nicotinamide mononucleotide adenylyltransferase